MHWKLGETRWGQGWGSRTPAPVHAGRVLALAAVLLLGAAVSLAAQGTKSAQPAGPQVTAVRVTVTVLDPHSQPVEGAGVVLRQMSTEAGVMAKHPFQVELHTNNHGQITVQGFQPGIVLVQVIASGYRTYGQAFIMKHADESVHVKLHYPGPQV